MLPLPAVLRLSWCVLFIAASLGCQSGPELGRAGAPLRIGSDLTNDPFAFVDGDGVPGGLEVEMMHRIAAELGRPLEIHRIPFEELIDAVEAGEIDIACATMGITEERAKRIAFSDPYFETSIAVVVRNRPGDPKTIADLATARLSASKGTTSEFAVRARLPHATIAAQEKDGAPVAERLLNGTLTGAVMDGPNADALAKEMPELRVLTEPLAEERYAMVLAKDEKRLLRSVNTAIEELARKGALPRLSKPPESAKPPSK